MKTVKYETFAGQHISQVIEEALDLSIRRKCFVEIDFNGTTIFVDFTESCDECYWLDLWTKTQEAARAAYQNTPTYKTKELKRKQEVEEIQVKVGKMLVIFEGVEFKNGHSLDTWFEDFIPLADHIGVEYDAQVITTALESLGYKVNAYVDYEGEWGVEESRGWIYGQILDGLRRKIGIHPLLADKLKGLPS